MENINFYIEFLKYFVLINFIWMCFSQLMITYIYNGYSVFKKIYPGSEDEYKKLLATTIQIWKLLWLFFGLIPLITLLIIN